MKIFFKSLMTLAAAVFFLASCDKVEDLPFYGTGNRPDLSASTVTLAAAAADSLNNLVTFSWTNPKYATDSSNCKYILQIDSAGRNWDRSASRIILGTRSITFTAKEINEILLGFGFKFNNTYSIQARLISSYGNNNDRYFSDTIAMTAVPYKIPPKVELPFTERLYIVGGGTDFGWNNSLPFATAREFTRLDETTWGGIFHLDGVGEYLLLPEAGSWANKYSVENNSIPGSANAGIFGYNYPQNFPGNVAQGNNWYKMIFDFQFGKYTVTKVDHPLADQLFIVGDGTAEGWTNSPSTNQQFTRLNNGEFEITLPLQPGKLYKFLNTNGQWQPQFGGNSASGGDLGANYGGGGDPDAIPTPNQAGNYKITVNFVTMKYKVELQ
jgi:hypothetical protein